MLRERQEEKAAVIINTGEKDSSVAIVWNNLNYFDDLTDS